MLREVLGQPVALLAADGSALEGDPLEAPARFDLDAPQRIEVERRRARAPARARDAPSTVAWLASRTPAPVEDWAATTAAALEAAEPAVRATLAAQRLDCRARLAA